MNITSLIHDNARRFPDRKAIIEDKTGAFLSFRQFSEQANQVAANLRSHGVGKGCKVAFFVKPSLAFHTTIFALFQIGAVPVFIDPGVGWKQLLAAVGQAAPEVLIAEPLVLFVRKLFRSVFASVKLAVSPRQVVGERRFPRPPTPPSPLFILEDDVAAIIFTSGATGAPKGVVYTNGNFQTQVKLLAKILPTGEGDTDISCFPLFSLFSLALGMSSVIPDMNPSKPAQVDAGKIVRAIRQHNAAQATGSSAIWERVADFCLEKDLQLPSLRGILMFGAPVSVLLHQKLKKVMPAGSTYTPYGATECLPVSWISGEEILHDCQNLTLQGKGTCVGTPFPETDVLIIKETDGPIPEISQVDECAPFSIGEILVSGKQTTREYFQKRDATELAKIKDPSGRIWHRMGDLGYKDERGRIWFCGRKVHKFETEDGPVFPIMGEAIFNQDPEVKRTAIVGLLNGTTPCLVVERKDGRTKLSKKERMKFHSELLALGARHKLTAKIQSIVFHNSFPVDYRHNIKIDRIALRDQIILSEKRNLWRGPFLKKSSPPHLPPKNFRY